MKPWTEEEGYDIRDKKPADKAPSGVRVYRYAPSLAKDGREIIALRRYFIKKDGQVLNEGWRGKAGYHPHYCPVELYQVPELIEALQKLARLEAKPREITTQEDMEKRRLMR